MELHPMLKGESVTRLLQGAGAGIVLTAAVGFGWGGWTLGSTARQMADQSAITAVSAALVPLCLDKFQHAENKASNLVEFKKVSTWNQSDFVDKGGWATFPGSSSAATGVAQACAKAIEALK